MEKGGDAKTVAPRSYRSEIEQMRCHRAERRDPKRAFRLAAKLRRASEPRRTPARRRLLSVAACAGAGSPGGCVLSPSPSRRCLCSSYWEAAMERSARNNRHQTRRRCDWRQAPKCCMRRASVRYSAEIDAHPCSGVHARFEVFRPRLDGISAASDDALVLGGPLVRLRMSAACVTASSKKAMGKPLAARDERVSSIMERMARSATPFS
eukprot:6185803-Pleurochrysis_carterae.AAC.1